MDCLGAYLRVSNREFTLPESKLMNLFFLILTGFISYRTVIAKPKEFFKRNTGDNNNESRFIPVFLYFLC